MLSASSTTPSVARCVHATSWRCAPLPCALRTHAHTLTGVAKLHTTAVASANTTRADATERSRAGDTRAGQNLRRRPARIANHFFCTVGSPWSMLRWSSGGHRLSATPVEAACPACLVACTADVNGARDMSPTEGRRRGRHACSAPLTTSSALEPRSRQQSVLLCPATPG